MKLTEEQMAINRLLTGNTAHSCKADYIKLAIKALEKQVPKKIWGNEYNHVHVGDTVNGLCPICNTEFVCITPRYYKENGFGYCKQCGQKLDWSDTYD